MRSISPGKVDGAIRAPHSKSVFQRAVACALLARGRSTIRGGRPSGDDLSALAVAEAMGAEVARLGESVEVSGLAFPRSGVLNCGESGLCLRTFAAVAALFDCAFELEAEGSLRKRPVDMVAAPLIALGADCSTNSGLPPLRIKGPIHGGRVEVDGTVSSQFVTGLMIALPRCIANSEISAPNLKSKPYVELTARVLERFGVEVEADADWERFAIKGGQRYRAAEIAVEGDWSGAAFHLVAGAIAGRVTVSGLDPDSLQPDRAILDALESAGARIEVSNGSVTASESTLRAFSFDATDSPDLFPPLAALALSCDGTSEIEGATRLAHKESDRAKALAEEFGKLGANIEVEGDVMRIEGRGLRGGRANSRGDHRIAMALAVAALDAKGDIEIEGDEAVAKSYPDFFADFERIGAKTR